MKHPSLLVWLLTVLPLVILMMSGSIYAAETDYQTGAAAFARHCSYCHGPSGDGSEPWYPAMERVAKLRKPSEMVETILSGKFQRAGELRGHTIPIMPAWARLANEDIAAIINYIQATWGTSEISVTTEDVAMSRGRIDDHAPPLDGSGMARAQEIYLERCVGCHGISREGTVGSPLLPASIRLNSTEAAKAMIHYGSSKGMPGFGVAEQLSGDEIQTMADFLRQPVPDPPTFAMADIRSSRMVFARQSTVKPTWSVDDLFVALRHDTGGVLFIDGKRKTVIGEVPTDVAPHDITVSADQRYAYVLSRGGRIAQIDLTTNPPQKVASTRVGFEARSLTASRLGKTGIVAASTYYPGHVVLLHGETLQPLTILDPRPGGSDGGQFRLSQIVNVPNQAKLLIAAKDQGFLHVIDTSVAEPNLHSTPTKRFLRAGTFDPSGTYFVIPTDDEELVIYDTEAGRVVETVHVPGLSGASKGVFYRDAEDGLIWVASAMADATLTFVGVPSVSDPGSWRVLKSMKTAGAGSLFVATHAASQHVWFDTPLNASPSVADAVYAVDKQHLEKGYVRLPILSKLGTQFKDARVLHPQFNNAGDELWVTVWNRQDERSAVVVIDDETSQIRSVIEDPRLTTPIRTYALWQFKN